MTEKAPSEIILGVDMKLIAKTLKEIILVEVTKLMKRLVEKSLSEIILGVVIRPIAKIPKEIILEEVTQLMKKPMKTPIVSDEIAQQG